MDTIENQIVTSSHNDMLTAEFMAEEVKAAVFQLSPNKALKMMDPRLPFIKSVGMWLVNHL